LNSDTTTVASQDGTPIVYVSHGSGPPVVMVHGSLLSGNDWQPVAERLADRYRVSLMDRRAHGASGSGVTAPTLEREIEDVSAVLAEVGPGACLVGHSSGAVVALHVALAVGVEDVAHLVLYEPPLPLEGPIGGTALALYGDALRRQQPEEALVIGLTKFANMSAEDLRQARSSPEWVAMVAAAPTWLPEVQALDCVGSDTTRYRRVNVPTLLLLGSQSPERPLKESTAALSRVLPNARTFVLVGHGHRAEQTAPATVAEAIASFLGDSQHE
jgi:pimeloyl-ACP methyl ester carboxylesterase